MDRWTESHRGMGGQMDAWTNVHRGQRYGWADGWMDKCTQRTEVWVVKGTDGQVDRERVGWTHLQSSHSKTTSKH